MLSAATMAPRTGATYTIETERPRASAMAYAKRLVREHGVALRDINYRRGPDGVLMVSGPACPSIRFEQLVIEER
jgi:pyruvate/2-oxoglutarate dehydrogenase complex dihydrolipoamide acyltransferase (E2) component